MSFTIEGVDEAARALQQVAGRLNGLLEEAVADTTSEVVDVARQFAPVDTGRLRNSIQARTSGLDGEASTDVEYAPYVEFGTSRRPAKPFLAPAAEIVRQRFVGRIHDAGRAIE